MKLILIGGISAVAIYSGYKAFLLNELKNKVTVKTKNTLDWAGRKLHAKVIINNPTGGKVTITKPHVTILKERNGSPIAASEVSHEKIKIEANSTTTFNISLSLLKSFQVAHDVINFLRDFFKKGNAKIYIVTQTNICVFTAVFPLPTIVQTFEIPNLLKKGVNAGSINGVENTKCQCVKKRTEENSVITIA